MQRQFFSGNSIEQAVMSAARHYKIDPDVLAYSVRDKKHGFLNIRRRVVIEVDPNQLEKVEQEAPKAVEVAAKAAEKSQSVASVDAVEESPEASAPEEGENHDGVLGLMDAVADASDDVHSEETDANDSETEYQGRGSEISDDGDDESADDDGEEAREEEEDRRPRGRRGRRSGQKNRPRRRDVTIEEFSWDSENDSWGEEDLDDDEDSRELLAVEICLERILDVMDLEIEYSIVEGETVEIEFSGEDSDFLIEEDGKVLKAIEHIVPRMARAVIGRSLAVHVDCDGFRADHENTLKKMASDAADEVVRRGRAKTLSPMNPADRRIVHLALVDHDEVDTVSQGHGFMKRVKIVLAN